MQCKSYKSPYAYIHKQSISMKALITSLVLFICSMSVVAQTYSIGHTQLTFSDASRGNRSIPVEVYYPAQSTGDNVPVADGSFPVLVFGHGFLMTVDAYDVIWNSVVPEGFIMVLPTTEGSFAPSHTDFGKDLAFLVDAIKTEGLTNSSAFYEKVAPTSAVMGHSMGGGSAFLAVQYNSSITALATLAAAVTNPSSVTAAAGITIPSLTISGKNDCVAPPADHQLPMYNALASGCKSYVNILGASHCQFAGSSFTCSFGEATCSPGPAIAPGQQQLTAAVYLNNWLTFYLKDACTAGEEFQTMISSAISIEGQQNCALSCTTTGQHADTENIGFQLLPNPAQQEVMLYSEIAWKNAEVQVLNICGQQLAGYPISNSNTVKLNLNQFDAGMYFIRVLEAGKMTRIKQLIIAR